MRRWGATAISVIAFPSLAACATPTDESPTASSIDFTACMVSDFGGFNDRGFNQAVLAGLTEAEEVYGVRTVPLESKSENDYGPNLEQAAAQGCDFTVTVGFSLAEATEAAAQADPDRDYAIVDDASIELPNVKPLVFDTAQASFLAGYLAAGYTKTGTVAVFGGQPFPPVLLFMDGYADGVEYYNSEHGTDVQLLGWNKASQEGTFSGTFVDIAAGKTLTQTFIDQGADVIMPVAGSLYQGSAEAVRDSGTDVVLIGVDNDIVEVSPELGDVFLSSVMKQMADAVVELIGHAVNDEFTTDPYVGDLANVGVELAPFHDFEDEVPADLAAELDGIRAAIVDGSIAIESANSPR
jgi:basic membrane protein A